MPWQTIAQTNVGRWASRVECWKSGGNWTDRLRVSGDVRLLGIPALHSTVGQLRALGLRDDIPAEVSDAAYAKIPWTADQLDAIRGLRITYDVLQPSVEFTLTADQLSAWDAPGCSVADLVIPKTPSNWEGLIKQWGDTLDVLYDEGLLPPRLVKIVEPYLTRFIWGGFIDPVYAQRLIDRGLARSVVSEST